MRNTAAGEQALSRLPLDAFLRRSWAEIDLDRLKDNLAACTEEVSLPVMAVVKADAYGHGAVPVARALAQAGIRDFAVSNAAEAVELRQAGIGGQLLILGYTPTECWQLLLDNDITQAILDEEYARALAGHGVKAQFAIDTGMNRIGLDAEKPEYCEKVIRQYADGFRLTGLFTHLCVADTPSEIDFTRRQLSRFKGVTDRVADMDLPYIHAMNSAGGLFLPGEGSLVRLGIVLYGLKPDIANELPRGVKPVMAWKSVVSVVKDVFPGETVGYGRTYQATAKCRIATVSVGYADGYFRSLSGKGKVRIRGKVAQVTGRVCMDQMMVDVTDIEGVCPGDEVDLLWDGYTADEMGRDAGTIGYEVVCTVSKRVPRIYRGRDK